MIQITVLVSSRKNDRINSLAIERQRDAVSSKMETILGEGGKSRIVSQLKASFGDAEFLEHVEVKKRGFRWRAGLERTVFKVLEMLAHP